MECLWGIEFCFVEGVRVIDVIIYWVFVGFDFGCGCVNGGVWWVMFIDFVEDGFDVSGDVNEFLGVKIRDIWFIDVVVCDVFWFEGNVFEIEDGVEDVFVEDLFVENVVGNGFGLWNYWVVGK